MDNLDDLIDVLISDLQHNKPFRDAIYDFVDAILYEKSEESEIDKLKKRLDNLENNIKAIPQKNDDCMWNQISMWGGSKGL